MRSYPALAVTTLILTLAAAGAAYAGMGEILASWPAPASTFNRVNGLAFEGEYIWLKEEVSWEEGRGVFKCTKAGSVINEIGFPHPPVYYSYGLAYDGEYLWTIYQWYRWPSSDDYLKYTTNGSRVGGFSLHEYNYGSKALAWDGQYLYTNETRPGPDRIGKYTTAGTLVATFPMTVGVGSDMAYYKRQLWHYGGGGLVYGVTLNGSVVGSFPAPGGSCRAVGFDGEYLWTADANRPQYIYKVDIDVVDVGPESFGKIKGIYR